jgi:hypothetical protein
MLQIGSTVYYKKGRCFAKIIRRGKSALPFADCFGIIYENDAISFLIKPNELVEVNPDTPENRLLIQLKYS